MIERYDTIDMLEYSIESILPDILKRQYFFVFPNENAYIASLCVIPAIEVYIDGVVVIENTKPLGIIGSKDILLAYLKYGKEAFYKEAREIMFKIDRYIKESTTLSDVIDYFKFNRIGFAPITRDYDIIGIISIRDILKFIAKMKLADSIEWISSRLVTADLHDRLGYALELMFKKNIRRLVMEEDHTYAITDRNILGFLMDNEFGKQRYEDPLDAPLYSLDKYRLFNVDLSISISEAARLMMEQLGPSALLVSNNYILTPWDLIKAFSR